MVSVNVAAIPEKLKEHNRWLLWDSSSDTPRRPHWRGDFGISWSDSEDWHTFAEATAAATERESWGIGFVFTSDLDMYAIDIDGPYSDDGEPHDWFPGVDVFADADAYLEWSPSGNGIHIPRVGEPPEWWSDCEVGPDVHQGVDVLENKFCTITGDIMDESGGDVDDTAPDSWFTQAYHRITGDLPNVETSTDRGNQPDAELTEEQIEEALSHVDSNLHYSDWLRVGMAVYDWDSGATGKRVFENWSRSNPKWDADDGQPHIDDIWSGSPNGQVSIGTLVHFAKQGGWDPPWQREWADVEVGAVEQLLEVAGTSEDGLTGDQTSRLLRLAAGLSEGDYEDLAGNITTAAGIERRELDRHRELARHAQKFSRIKVENGSTWYITQSEPHGKVEILNFELNIYSILRMDNEEFVQANLGDGREIQFSPTKLQRPQRFRDLIGDYVGLTFAPPPQMARETLNEINEYIGALDVPVRRGTRHIGLHGEEWVTPAGAITADGWADDPDTVYVERKLGLERKLALPSQEGDFDGSEVREILRSLPDIRATERFLPVLGWFYAAPFRPLIFDDWNAGQFNHLNITGDTGSGKTTSLRYLWRCFGAKGDPFSVTDTKFTMTATMAASNGLPVWYDEYKPSAIQDYKLDGFHELYRKAATGQIESRGNADQTTTEYELKAPLVVSGEEQIRLPAERRRSIMVAFRKDVTDKGTDTRLAFKELAGEGHVENGELVLPSDVPDPQNHAIAYYRWAAGANRNDLRAMWQDARELVWSLRQDWPGEHDLDDLEIQGLRTVAFGWSIMRRFAEDHGLEPDELPDKQALDQALLHVAGEIGSDGQRKTHMDNFIELFVRAYNAGYLDHNKHYTFVHEGQPGEELRIHLGQTFDSLSKYAKDHDLDSTDLLSNADDYRKRFKEAASTDGGYVSEWSQYTPQMGRCVSISTVKAMNQLEFDRSMFDVSPMDESGGQSAAADGGDEMEGLKAKILEELRLGFDAGDTIKAPALSGRIGSNPDDVAERLDTLARERAVIAKVDDETFEVL